MNAYVIRIEPIGQIDGIDHCSVTVTRERMLLAGNIERTLVQDARLNQPFEYYQDAMMVARRIIGEIEREP